MTRLQQFAQATCALLSTGTVVQLFSLHWVRKQINAVQLPHFCLRQIDDARNCLEPAFMAEIGQEMPEPLPVFTLS